jgi:cell volume regulation protein A
VQGTTIPLAARALRVEASTVEDRSPAEAHLAARGESAIVTLEVGKGAVSAGRSIVELDWPRESLILVIYRGNEFFVPNGASVLQPGDRLIVLTTRDSIEELQRSVAQSAVG